MTSPSLIRSAVFNVLRAGFRALPISAATQDLWRNWFLDRFPSIRPKRAALVASTSRAQRRPRVSSSSRAIGYVERRITALPEPLPARLIAFYLPQFHTIPENDAAWGEGFTEWLAVTRALPQFEGHSQPRLPGSLGYYDLRNPEVLRAQASLAREFGISGFCMYAYWFHGRTLLDMPLWQWFNNKTIDMPLCLCWANESWTRTWDGRATEVIIPQAHDAEDDVAFIAHHAPLLGDSRYLRVDGKPILLVYRPGLLPDPKATASRWREWCRVHGVGEIYLAYVQSFERIDPRDIGFDAAIEFPPNLCTSEEITSTQTSVNPDYVGSVLDWRDLPKNFLSKPASSYPLHPTVNTGWDNEPRRSGRGRSFLHSAPRRYRDWLRSTIARRTSNIGDDAPLVFINAWNEWAEGAVLEPDARLGHAWLHATLDALSPPVIPPSRPCVVIHAWYPEVLTELLSAVKSTGSEWRVVITTSSEKISAVRACINESGLVAEIEVHENRGRDILPFLRVANRLLDEGENIVLKLHTKRSLHRTDGDQWRRDLLAGLLGPASAIFGTMNDDESLGMVVPRGHLTPMDYFWGDNELNIRYLMVRLGFAKDVLSESFASGSMFWVKLEALRPLLDAHLDEWEFEAEAKQLDGTMAHAIERLTAQSCREAGFEVVAWPRTTSLTDRSKDDYPYARRG